MPCGVDGRGAHPLPQPPLPAAAAARTGLLKAIDRLVLEASLEGSHRALMQAFALHPLCGGIDAAPGLVRLATREARPEAARA